MLDKSQCTHNQEESMGIRENFTEEMALRCPALIKEKLERHSKQRERHEQIYGKWANEHCG